MFEENPYFSAGFGLLGVGTGLAMVKTLCGKAGHLIKQRFIVSCEVHSRDIGYQWLLQWLTQQTAGQTRQISLQNGGRSIVPSPGIHFLRWQGRYFRVERTRDSAAGSGAAMTGGIIGSTMVPSESVTLSTIGRGTDIFLQMMAQARFKAMEQERGKTIVYTSWGSEWRPFGAPRRKRPLSSVVLDEGIATDILSDIKRFLANASWYHDRGIPYRRGYLLYGHPGTGKSSFIQALAGALDYNICMLSLGASGSVLTDDRLAHLLSNVPDKSIILLEDVDAAFSSSRSVGDKSNNASSYVTFSGLLNALDGVAASENRILFMTTNHLEALDPALIRPGRVDVKHFIGLATRYQIETLFSLFYPSASIEMAKTFSSSLTNGGEKVSNQSMAQIQAHFVLFKDDPEAAIRNLGLLGGEKIKIKSTAEPNGKITLKGSIELISEFFEYSVNSILYQRGLYPPQDFRVIHKYGLPLYITIDDSLSHYIRQIMDQVKCWVQSHAVQKLVLVVTSLESLQVLERWQFDLHCSPDLLAVVAKENTKQPSLKEIQAIQKEIQAVMRQISATVSFLPILQESCSFELLVYTDKDRVGSVADELWIDSDPKLVINSESVRLKSFSTSIHAVDSMVSFKV